MNLKQKVIGAAAGLGLLLGVAANDAKAIPYTFNVGDSTIGDVFRVDENVEADGLYFVITALTNNPLLAGTSVNISDLYGTTTSPDNVYASQNWTKSFDINGSLANFQTSSPGQLFNITDNNSLELVIASLSGNQDLSNLTQVPITITTQMGLNVSGFGYGYAQPQTAPVPEPGTCLLLAAGVAGLYGFRRRESNTPSDAKYT